MANRDSTRDHRRRGRGRQEACTSKPPPDVEEENAFATLDRNPSQTLQPQFVMPTPGYDPQFNFPYFDSTQAQPQLSNGNITQSHVGNNPDMTTMTPVFWQTYGRYMPYIHNLVLNLFWECATEHSAPPSTTSNTKL